MEVASGKACLSEVEEVEAASPPPVEDRVFVAVPEDFKNGRKTLLWALENPAKDCTGVVIAHVHRPAQMIPVMGAEFHHSILEQQVVKDYRRIARVKAEENLDEYVRVCRRQKVSCEKVIIEKDDVAGGLEELIALHGITKLVVGTRSYRMKTKSLTSKTALRLVEVAASSCKIWFTCNGHLVHTREANTCTTFPAIPPPPAFTFASKSSVTSIGSDRTYSELKWKSPLYESYDGPTGTSVTISGSALPHQMQEPDNEDFSSPELENPGIDNLLERHKQGITLREANRYIKSMGACLNQVKRQRARRDKYSLRKVHAVAARTRTGPGLGQGPGPGLRAPGAGAAASSDPPDLTMPGVGQTGPRLAGKDSEGATASEGRRNSSANRDLFSRELPLRTRRENETAGDDSGSVSMYHWNKSEDSEPGGDIGDVWPGSAHAAPSTREPEPERRSHKLALCLHTHRGVQKRSSGQAHLVRLRRRRYYGAGAGARPNRPESMSRPSSTKSAPEAAGMQDSNLSSRADAVCIGHLDANLQMPSGSKVTMNPSGGTMETPVTCSLGAMGPLLRKVDLLLIPKYPLGRSVKHAIQLLKEDLEDINDALVAHSFVEQSFVDSPNNMAKYWMHEARELSYDVEDAIDTLMLPRTATDGKVRVRPVHGHRVGRLKVKGLPNIIKPLTRIAELRTLLQEASERHQRYELDVCISNPSFLFSGHSSRIPVPREVTGNLVGIDAPKNELTTWLTARAEQLKVLCIVGPAGVGKTALAKELYRELGSQFECRAFVRVSRTPHMSRLLAGILSQIQRPKQNSDTCSVPNIIDEIRKHLQDKRYFIVIDGLWEARIWDIIKSAFPKGHNCSRIMITCEVKDVATKFCSYHSIDVFELKPLGSQDSEKLFFDTMSGSNVQCHDQFKEVSCRISRACAGLPLATITIAGLLASQPDNSDLWHHLLQHFCSDLANLTLEEMLKEAVNLCYTSLPQDLKTCLLYLTMYPEGCSIRKADLLKQWIAEDFISPTTEEKERVAENYFAELVNRGMIQPEKIIHNDEVISCTVHHIVFDAIMHKSREVSFTAAVDYSQSITEFFTKIYRLFLYFSCAQYATKLKGIRLTQIRSLSFYGLLRCMPSVTQLRLLRVLILEVWDDNDECNLSRISGLVLLKYLKISRIASHLLVKLPSKIQDLKFLETLEIDARVRIVPDDIVHLPGLLHLSIQGEVKLPEGIGRVTSLQTLQYFDLGNNSEDNVQSLCELINLRDLHITCSTALSDAHLKRKFVVLAASLPKLTNLRSLTVAPGAISMTMSVDYSSAMLSTPMFLQRLELLPPICIFSRLPEWVGKLQKLRILKIVVRVLLSGDIDVLTGLPGLTVLSLYIRQPNTQRVVFSSGALPVLKYFKYTCGALFLAFQEEALPNLERLKLCFNVHKDEMYDHMNSGIENLLSLKGMTVNIGAADGAKESDKKAAESAIESAIRKHPRFPIYMNVKSIAWVEEE